MNSKPWSRQVSTLPRAATATAAELLGREDIGVLERGRVADIVAMPGDPIADIGRTAEVDFVMRSGHLHRIPDGSSARPRRALDSGCDRLSLPVAAAGPILALGVVAAAPGVADGPGSLLPPGSWGLRRAGQVVNLPHPLLNDYGVAYSTNALTWGRKPAGGCSWTDAAWSSACKKVNHLRPTSTVTLIVSTVPLPLRILTVAGIVAGALGSPKVSYASERATVVNLTAPGLLGRWEWYYALQSPGRATTGLLVDEDGIRT